jgi:hypothetical protein
MVPNTLVLLLQMETFSGFGKGKLEGYTLQNYDPDRL